MPKVFQGSTRLDSAENVFFARQLEHIYAQTYDKVYADLKARMFVPVSNAANPGATTVTWRQMDYAGAAKIIGANAKDVPRVDVFGSENTRPVRTCAASYGYTVMDVRAAAMAGTPLSMLQAEAARRAVELCIDEVASIGAPAYGIASGFINSASVPTQTAPVGTWGTATADQIIADVADQLSDMSLVSKGVEKPNTLLVPDSTLALLMTKPRSTNSDMTLKAYLEANFEVRIFGWHRLETAGAGSTKRVIMYNNSPNKLTQEIPSEFEQLPVQEQGLEFVVHTMAKTAGMDFYYPLSASYMDDV